MKSFTIKVSSLLVLFAVSVTGYACPSSENAAYNNADTDVLSAQVMHAVTEQYAAVLED